MTDLLKEIDDVRNACLGKAEIYNNKTIQNAEFKVFQHVKACIDLMPVFTES